MPLVKLGTPQESHSTSQGEGSILNIPEDQIKALTNNITNATIARVAFPQSLSTVEKNFQGLQKRLSLLSKQIRFKVDDQELGLRVKAPGVSRDLPILFMKDIEDSIDLSTSLPFTLQKPECTTILDLLKTSFPKLTSSLSFNKGTKIPRFVFSSPIPLDDENKGNFFPQIESEGQIAYIAWDSSGSHIAKGLKKRTCDILLKNEEAFCGVALSQDNLRGIEKGAGVSAHFMTSKVTVIGILITKPSISIQTGYWRNGNMARVACDSDDDLVCDGFYSDSNRLIPRGGSSSEGHTTFGMLGVEGASVSSAKRGLSDRFKNAGEKLIPFCLEIVPQFSSEETQETAVHLNDLEMAIEMQFQELIFQSVLR